LFICAGDIEEFDFAKSVGIGMVDVAINLTRICLFDKPDFIAFVGSAGSYGKNHNIFDIVESRASANVELSFLENNSYTPIDNVLALDNSPIVNSSNYITKNYDLAQKFLKHKIELENMEFFSVMRVAKEFELPVIGVFVVTNYCNESAHSDFLKNHEEAKKRVREYVLHKYQKPS